MAHQAGGQGWRDAGGQQVHLHPLHRVPRGRALACTAILAAGCLWQRSSPDVDGRDVRLTILHTADIHSRLLPYDLAPLKTDRDLGIIPAAAPFGGVARMGALIKRERLDAERAVLLDSGDCFQGAPIFNQNNGEPEIRWLGLMHADAVVIGNHEFDAGALNFAKKAEYWAKYPLLAANYDFTRPDVDDPTNGVLGRISQPYTILNVDGLLVAVIGMANLSSLNSIVEGGNSMGITPLEQNETLRAWVSYLKPQVHLLVVVSHLGLTEDQQLVTGYDTVFQLDRIRPFLERKKDPWVVEEDYRDGRVLVRIPGVTGIDVIMGGHLHVVLDPPQVLQDPAGRNVVIQHSGAFAKYLGRLDLILRDGEVKAHSYRPFPIDSLWCIDPQLRDLVPPYSGETYFQKLMSDHAAECSATEDADTHRLLDPYVLSMGEALNLPMIFAYAPQNIERRNSSGGGDSPLGDLTADAMRRRRRVEAEFSMTNTLGIRDNLYAGPITLESMFNVFPFENTITVIYLSGVEVQEVFDFMTEKSAGRGCQSQGQIAGARFVMDCARVIENERLAVDPQLRCTRDQECRDRLPAGSSASDASEWICNLGACYRHPAHDIAINNEPLNPVAIYKVAVNDYIAKGGSGFRVLKRNTTKIDTGISLRDALIDALRKNCTCDELENPDRPVADRCAPLFGGIHPERTKAPALCDRVRQGTPCSSALAWCAAAKTFQHGLEELPGSAKWSDWQSLGAKAVVNAGKCPCHELLPSAEEPAPDASPGELAARQRCGHVTEALKTFCRNPRGVPVIAAQEDGRIERRVK